MTNPGDVPAQSHVWKETPIIWGMLILTAIVLAIPFADALNVMVSWWLGWPEYSHGIMLPFIAIFLFWQKKDELDRVKFEGSYIGCIFVATGILLFIVGELSSLYTVMQYAFWFSLFGFGLSYLGWKAMRITWAAWLILFMMIPLPNFLTWNLSSQLQLISSQIGVFVIRLFGISVYLEGNVIDLGAMKLQVVEACSGLRYLFPLMTLGVIIAYFFKAPLWQKLFIFASSIPITVFMNSFRIGLIGVTVEYWGKSMAEGVLHDFEGWVVFMTSFGVMLAEMLLFLRLSRSKQTLADSFVISLPSKRTVGMPFLTRKIPRSLMLSLALMILAIPLSTWLPERVEYFPARNSFLDFPMKLGEWSGGKVQMEKAYIDELKFSDYIMANYEKQDKTGVSFYIAWYDSQRKGRSAHSPKTCLPGGGWEISEFSEKIFPDYLINNQALKVNRAIIRRSNEKQLVYYWFQQRGRVITNEYLVKLYLLWDGITRNRSDGALIRIVAPVPVGTSTAVVDQQMSEFIGAVLPVLSSYVPN